MCATCVHPVDTSSHKPSHCAVNCEILMLKKDCQCVDFLGCPQCANMRTFIYNIYADGWEPLPKVHIIQWESVNLSIPYTHPATIRVHSKARHSTWHAKLHMYSSAHSSVITKWLSGVHLQHPEQIQRFHARYTETSGRSSAILASSVACDVIEVFWVSLHAKFRGLEANTQQYFAQSSKTCHHQEHRITRFLSLWDCIGFFLHRHNLVSSPCNFTDVGKLRVCGQDYKTRVFHFNPSWNCN